MAVYARLPLIGLVMLVGVEVAVLTRQPPPRPVVALRKHGYGLRSDDEQGKDSLIPSCPRPDRISAYGASWTERVNSAYWIKLSVREPRCENTYDGSYDNITWVMSIVHSPTDGDETSA